MLADTVSELTNAELVLSDDVLAGAVMELADAVLVGTNAVLVGTNAVLDLANDVSRVSETDSVYIVSLYLKSAVIGLNNNSIPLTVKQKSVLDFKNNKM